MRISKIFRKVNNKGFSLAELVIAIAILSLIAVGFYSSFVVVARTNAKAKIQHKATSLAQNLMENLKAERVEDILCQVVFPTYTTVDGGGNVVQHVNFRILPEEVLGSGYDYSNNVGHFGTMTSPYATSTDGGITSTYNQDLDVYQFYLRNLKMEETKFDALVTVDSSAYMGDVAGKQDFNAAEVVRIPSMDAKYDAVAANAREYDTEAIMYFDTLGKDLATINGNMERTIKVDITRDVKLSGNVEQVAKASYIYTCDGETYAPPADLIFNNAEDFSVNLRNVFIFFNPQYDWTASGAEKIIVNYPKDMELDLYLIKQQPTSDPLSLTSYETRPYEVIVEANTTTDNGSPYAGANKLSIRTNLGYQYGDPTQPFVGTNPKQAKYYHNGAPVPADDLESFFDLAGLTNKGQTDKLFDVKVEIYLADPTVTIDEVTDYTVDLADNLRATLESTLRN